MPDRGARVRLELDKSGFIRALQVLDQAPTSMSSSNRDSTITRLACLKAAATFCAGKALNTEVSSQYVLKIAEAFERGFRAPDPCGLSSGQQAFTTRSPLKQTGGTGVG